MDAARELHAGAEARSDYLEKVTGEATFASDVVVPGMLQGRVLRSTLPHAKIRSIDISAAQAMPGVVAVLTGKDLEGMNAHWGLYLRDRPVIAIDRVRYVGEPVAAVAAVDEFTAEEALDAILVDYEPLPHVTDAGEAMQPAAPLLHDAMVTQKDFYFRGEAKPVVGTNIFQHYQYEHGAVDAAFATAARVFEDSFRFPMVFHYAMEPHVVVADCRPDSLELWSCGQAPTAVQKVCAQLFGLPLARVRVHSPYVGGGFGGKASVKIDPLVAALSRKAGRPVRVCLSINESMLTCRRLSADVHLKTAVDAEGKLVAKSVRVVMNGGAYADTGPGVAIKSAIRAIGPYRFPHLRLEAFAVYTNTVPGAAFRSIGGPQAVWATESQMDIIAAALGRDPVEYRLANMVEKGEAIRPDLRPLDVDLKDSLRKAVAGMDAIAGKAGTRGVAVAATDPGILPIAGAIVRLKADGSVLVLANTVEIGQGARGVLRTVASQTLRQPMHRVSVAEPDTNFAPFDWGTGASRSTVIMGLAVEYACADIAKQVCEIAAQVLGGDPVAYALAAQGVVGPGGETSFRDLLHRFHGIDSGEFIGIGRVTPASKSGGFGIAPLFWETAAGVCEVDLDEETGELHLARYVSAADVGRVINRKAAEGQDEGAAVQGMGHALYEEYVYEDGQPINASLIDYHVPTLDEAPDEMVTLLLESGDGPGPGGSRGMGEGGILPVAPAIANALARSHGVRIRELPLTPERVWRALRDAKKGGGK
ncbi:MAG: xanthine dehydrogenase family protein molybdopterin-binding subunit [Betaproteobacteria bacterium]|nr:xanthine dehydrogenase family protein molybdopterin-binding subunit [Betaproteobacteria bacterium]